MTIMINIMYFLNYRTFFSPQTHKQTECYKIPTSDFAGQNTFSFLLPKWESVLAI